MAIVGAAAPDNDLASPALPDETHGGRAGRAGLEQPMNAEPIDVITLFARAGAPDDELANDELANDELEREIAEWRALGRAVLVVLLHPTDRETIERLTAAGADLCVVAPTAHELFSHVERARRRHRHQASQLSRPRHDAGASME
jgi:hypothetical protein